MKKLMKYLMYIFLGVIIITFLVITMVNNSVSRNVVTTLKNTPLPQKTIICDSISSAGKLIGNGDGMQYFGAILIKSELNIDELNSYYKKYRINDWSYLVEPQNSIDISVVDHRNLKFKKLEESKDYSGYFIVYTWGDSNFVLQNFDFRANT